MAGILQLSLGLIPLYVFPVAKRVLEKKTVLFRDATLTLKPMEWDQKSVLVQGCGEDPQTDYLELLFESEEDSGGGPVENIDVTDCGVIITFQQTEGKRVIVLAPLMKVMFLVELLCLFVCLFAE